jgi:SAM-dependent methyltransferase
MKSDEMTLEAVRNYYGRVLKSSQDLQTSCCTAERLPAHLLEAEKLIHDEVKEKFYGCGSPLPPALEGATAVDLGCGSGRDTFLMSKLVGEMGQVIGVDMTPEQLSVAEKHLDYHRQQFGYARSNVRLVAGYIEDLHSIAASTVDVVVSNCVVNLSPDKRRVFREIFRVLKPGGELYFSDVFSGRRVPQPLKEDPVLLGECLGGALYIEDFRRMLREVGCLDYRVVSRRRITLDNPDNSYIWRKAGMIDFYSVTVRAFKLDLEDLCEDYGQVATYLGTIAECPHQFVLDDHHTFENGRPQAVCGNTAAMLSQSRYARHFRVAGDRSTHFGPFDCGPPLEGSISGACC